MSCGVQIRVSQPAEAESIRLNIAFVLYSTCLPVEQFRTLGDRIADRRIACGALGRHTGEHRDVAVDVVIDEHFALGVMKPVKTTGIFNAQMVAGQDFVGSLNCCAEDLDRHQHRARAERRRVDEAVPLVEMGGLVVNGMGDDAASPGDRRSRRTPPQGVDEQR